MKLHFLLTGFVAVVLSISVPNSLANGGGHSGGGGGHWGGGGHSGGNFHGGWHSGGFHGRGGHFHGRFFGPGFGFYGYGYPWWGWDYGYYPYPYYGDDAYYGGQYYGGQYSGDADPRFNSARAIQAALAWRGYYSGRIDGVMGPETRSAIRSFQAHEGLPVTGQIDSRLIDSLRR